MLIGTNRKASAGGLERAHAHQRPEIDVRRQMAGIEQGEAHDGEAERR